MPYNLLTLTFILFTATLAFIFASRSLSPLMPSEQFKRWRNSWYLVTTVTFLTTNFWLFIIVCGLYVLYMARRETNIFAFYFALLLAIPSIEVPIPGIGVDFILLDFQRLLSIVLLLPLYLSLRSKPGTVGFGKMTADKLILVILLLNFVLSLRGTTFTDAVRYGIISITDVFLPYYVASRAIKNLDQLKNVMIAFVIGALAVAAVAIFEFRSDWLLYNTLAAQWDIDWTFGSYLGRAGSLRAIASLGSPISLGYVLMVALGFYLFIAPAIKSRTIRALGIVFISTGIFVSLSRGPWVGAFILILVFLLTGPNAAKKMTVFTLVTLLALPTIALIPGGNKIIDVLPFIGTSEQFNVEYREELMDDSIEVIIDNPIFGVFDPTKLPELQHLVQGEGIIDIVNTYLSIALHQGLVGLALFIGFFWIILRAAYKAMKKFPKRTEEYLCGRSLISCMFGILVTIYTVSSIYVIPIIYFAVAGLMVSYARIAKLPVSTATESDSVSKGGNQFFPSTLIRK